MKNSFLFSLTIAVLGLSSCRNNNSQVVQENYIHKYGVAISKDQWVEQGQNGQLVQLDKNGVTINRCYQFGQLSGDTTYTFPNSSTIQRVEHYDDGVLTKVTTHYPSGVPQIEENVVNLQKERVTGWYEDGTPAYLEHYSNGYLVRGEYRTCSNEIESRIVDGHGTRTVRSGEGELLARENFQNGEMSERTTYFANGQPQSITPYEHHLIHGTRLTFLTGGVPASVEQWLHGYQDGKTVIYQNGERAAEIPYVRGKREGVAFHFRDGDQLVERVTWKSDRMNGPRTLYVDGVAASTEWYVDGYLASRPTFDQANPATR